MKVRKLTPDVLKKIIAEEKRKISKPKKGAKTKKPVASHSKKKKITLSEAVDEATRLALHEVQTIRLLKKIRSKRNAIRKKVKKFSK